MFDDGQIKGDPQHIFCMVNKLNFCQNMEEKAYLQGLLYVINLLLRETFSF